MCLQLAVGTGWNLDLCGILYQGGLRIGSGSMHGDFDQAVGIIHIGYRGVPDFKSYRDTPMNGVALSIQIFSLGFTSAIYF